MRRRLLGASAVLVALLAIDLARPASAQWTASGAIGAIHLYQATLSKYYAAAGVQCRFTLTCSHYGEACIRRFGAARGSWLALKRVFKCGPWTPLGTVDPPPAA